MDADIAWKPHPGKQQEFLRNVGREILFGGAAGPGKSDCLLMFPLHFIESPFTNWLVIRKNWNRLKDLIERSWRYYPLVGGDWEAQDRQWRFPSGAKIGFGHIEKFEDALRYKGPEFTGLAWDELTEHAADDTDKQGKPINRAFVYMQHRLRAPDPSVRLFIRAATNPGGPGHHWVRQRYSISDDGKPSKLLDPDLGTRREFIPARISDNPSVAGTNYEKSLDVLSEADRKALKLGRWDVYEGQAFSEWNPFEHVIEPFRIPSDWKRWRAMDDGFAKPACVLWFAEDTHGRIYVYDELYRTKQSPEDLAVQIKMKDKPFLLEGDLDSAAFSDTGLGNSRGERMNAKGCRWARTVKGPGSRVQGKSLVHSALAMMKDNGPGLVIFNTCHNLIATLPSIPYDKKNAEDVDTNVEDHAYDALRYGLQRVEVRLVSQRVTHG